MDLEIIFAILFFTGALVISWQDFKHRLVSLWVLVLYFSTCLASAYFLQGLYALLNNAITTLIYFGLIFGVVMLYYFVKEKKINNPVDAKIGLADLVLFIAIGITLNIIQLVLFFSVSFFISALLGLLWFNRKAQTVPLAGLLGLLHFFYYVIILTNKE